MTAGAPASGWPSLDLAAGALEGLGALASAVAAAGAAGGAPPRLRLSVRGLSTGPVPVDATGRMVELTLDLRDGWLAAETTEGAVRPLALRDGVVPAELLAAAGAALADVGAAMGLAASAGAGERVAYAAEAATAVWEALRRVDAIATHSGVASPTDHAGRVAPAGLRLARSGAAGLAAVPVELGIVLDGDGAAAGPDGGSWPVGGLGAGLFARCGVDRPPDAVDAPLAPASAEWIAEGLAWLAYPALRSAPEPAEAAEAFWRSAAGGFETAAP